MKYFSNLTCEATKAEGIKPELKLEALAFLSVQENQHNLQVQKHLPQKERGATHQHQSYSVKSSQYITSGLELVKKQKGKLYEDYTVPHETSVDLAILQTQKDQLQWTRPKGHKEHHSHHSELSFWGALLSQHLGQVGLHADKYNNINMSVIVQILLSNILL